MPYWNGSTVSGTKSALLASVKDAALIKLDHSPQVRDDLAHRHFMAPAAMLNAELLPRISTEYISQRTWRSHMSSCEFYSSSYCETGWAETER